MQHLMIEAIELIGIMYWKDVSPILKFLNNVFLILFIIEFCLL